MILPADNLIVLHDSLLPRYRGFAPLVSGLINGEPGIGVTALFADHEFDTGKIIVQQSLPVTYPLKINDAIKQVSILYCEIIEKILLLLRDNKELYAVNQNEKEASYSLWLDDEDYQINWSKDSVEISRFVDAVGFPYKGALTYVQNDKARVVEVEVLKDVYIENRVPGKVLFLQDKMPVVVCGSGLIKIKKLFWESGDTALPLKNFRTRFK